VPNDDHFDLIGKARKPAQVVSSPAILEPGAFGVLRPVLVLPDGIAGRLTPEQLESVFAH
jgi:bla regulator protein BlaR1